MVAIEVVSDAIDVVDVAMRIGIFFRVFLFSVFSLFSFSRVFS